MIEVSVLAGLPGIQELPGKHVRDEQRLRIGQTCRTAALVSQDVAKE